MTLRQLKAYFGIALLGSAITAALVPKEAKADITTATAIIEQMGIKSNPENIASTDLVVNLKEATKKYVTDGAIPAEYNDLVIAPTLTIDGFNYTAADVATKNAENYTKYLNEEAPEFKYTSLGTIFADDETKKEVFGILDRMMEEYSLNPSEVRKNVILAFVRENTAIVGTGARKAFLADLLYLNALDSLFTEPIIAANFVAPKLGVSADEVMAAGGNGEPLNDMITSFGDNSNEVTYIKTITGQGC